MLHEWIKATFSNNSNNELKMLKTLFSLPASPTADLSERSPVGDT